MDINGAKYAMPMIVLNLGGEMMYILNQRLQAQNIVDEKARKVLQDVAKAMFSDTFINELFLPQDVYDVTATKQIFEKLAHSSIMRLNKSSMDKLFDLMMMGFKYQLLQCNSPQQYFHLLLNHLDSVQDLIGLSGTNSFIYDSLEQSIQLYSTFSNSQWLQLKDCLMRFVKGKKIKVSLFLQNRMQGLDGVLHLHLKGKLPKGTTIPGTIKYYENEQSVLSRTFVNEFTAEYLSETHEYIDAESTVGMNMYVKDFRPEIRIREPGRYTVQAMDEILCHRRGGLRPKQKMSTISSKSMTKTEYNMLASLLGVDSSACEKDTRAFKIQLFPESIFDEKASDDHPGSSDSNSMITLDIDASADTKSVGDYLKSMNFDDDSSSSKHVSDSKNSNDDDDLLALMDSAK